MASSKQSASITIPADYLEDVRAALTEEVDSDSGALRMADSVERHSSAVILRRRMAVLDQALDATGKVTLTSEHDQIRSPLVHMLEALVRMHSERLGRSRTTARFQSGMCLTFRVGCAGRPRR
jgi:hypothetical protein